LSYIEGEKTMSAENKHIPWILWPFWALWRLVTLVVGLTGRLLAVALGLVFMIAGFVLSLTIVGLVVGVPLFLIGLLLVFRGLF
jgi:hypothetical protein